jgi:predicted RNA-binding protein Jag
VTDSRVSAVARVEDGRRVRAVEVLEQILRDMDVPATLEAKDLPDGGISISVQPGVDLQGLAPGRRSPVGDALQYLVNKLVNRPGLERRWVSVGIGGHPEPRGPKPVRAPVAAPAPVNGAGVPHPVAARPPPQPKSAPAPRGGEPDERALELPDDPVFVAAARTLAERSAATGRIYAVVALPPTERGQLLRAAAAVAGVSARAEGEGRLRRVVLTPDKVVPMPRQRLPVEDDEDLD